MPTEAGLAATEGVGGLIQGGCIQNVGRTDCNGVGGNAPGLAGAQGVAVSPDGKDVYVASAGSNAIAVLTRNPTTGALTPGGCIQNTGGTDCNGVGGTAPGLGGADGVAVSGDGKSVYVASHASGAIAMFTRNPTTGGLTPAGCIQEVGSACSSSGGLAPGLRGAAGVAVSGDGQKVYVASDVSNAVSAFTRNTTTGALTSNGCVEASGATPVCTIKAAGLDGANAVAVSGDDVYVASFYSDAVAIFVRNTTTGRLTPAGCIQVTGRSDCAVTAPGLIGPNDIAASADGRDVYVVSEDSMVGRSNAITVLSRNTTTGALASGGCIQNTGLSDCNGVGGTAPGLGDPQGVAVSADGKNVYVASYDSDTVAVFRRNTTTGGLTPAGCIQNIGGSDCSGGTAPGLHGAYGVAVSADGKTVYVASTGSDAIAAFERAALQPVVAIASPADGAHYKKGAVVRARYACFDPNGAAGVASCQGTVPRGYPIDTSTTGKHGFAVSAVDRVGNTASKTVSYTVIRPPAKPTIEKQTINAARHRARFSFVAARARGYRCALKHGTAKPRFAKCSSPKAYKGLKSGHYTFEVRGVSFGITGPVAKVKFAI